MAIVNWQTKFRLSWALAQTGSQLGAAAVLSDNKIGDFREMENSFPPHSPLFVSICLSYHCSKGSTNSLAPCREAKQKNLRNFPAAHITKNILMGTE